MVQVARSVESIDCSFVDVKVTAAIPCFNTESSIADVVSRTRRYVDKVIVIDDGCTDATAEVARAAGAKVISHVINKGYGEAIKSCFAEARADNTDVLVIIDGDGQHDPDEIPSLINPVLRQEAGLVIGSRFLGSGQGVPRYRKFGIGFITFLWNFGSNVKVSDTQSGFRAYSKELIEYSDLSEKGMGSSIEILEKARKSGARIQEVPITCSYENNNSTISTKAFKHGMGVALSVLRIRSNVRIKKNRGKLSRLLPIIECLGGATIILAIIYFLSS